MNRRAFLGTFGSILSAGCTSTNMDSTSNPPEYIVRIDGIEHNYTGIDITIEVKNHFEVLKNSTVSAIAKNTSNVQKSVEFGAAPPLHPMVGKHVDSGANLLLVPTSGKGTNLESPETSTKDRCWMIQSDDFIIFDAFSQMTLNPDDQIGGEYYLFNSPDEGRCLEKGEYRFTYEVKSKSLNFGIIIK